MRRFEYRVEEFVQNGGGKREETPPWWDRRENGTYPDWLNRLGAEGWELVAIEEQHHLYGKTGGGTVVNGRYFEWEGAIPAKRWTFRREVEG